MSIITGYAWRITTPAPGMRWSDEVRKVVRENRNSAFFSYIVVLILLFLLWPLSSINASYELCYLNNTPNLHVSTSFPIIFNIYTSILYASIIALMAAAIYGLYFTKVLLDTITAPQ
jgi:uncharacterized integral membrane protein